MGGQACVSGEGRNLPLCSLQRRENPPEGRLSSSAPPFPCPLPFWMDREDFVFKGWFLHLFHGPHFFSQYLRDLNLLACIFLNLEPCPLPSIFLHLDRFIFPTFGENVKSGTPCLFQGALPEDLSLRFWGRTQGFTQARQVPHHELPLQLPALYFGCTLLCTMWDRLATVQQS